MTATHKLRLELVYMRCRCCSCLLVIAPLDGHWERYRCPQCAAASCPNMHDYTLEELSIQQFAQECGLFTLKDYTDGLDSQRYNLLRQQHEEQMKRVKDQL